MCHKCEQEGYFAGLEYRISQLEKRVNPPDDSTFIKWLEQTAPETLKTWRKLYRELHNEQSS